MNGYVSRLADKLCAFVSFKNALGIKYETCQVHLRQLDQYNLAHGNYGTLTKEVAEGWALERAARTESRDRSWIPPIREFGRYLRSIGDTEAYVLDDRFAIQHYHAEVYLMTQAEIRRFFAECDSCAARSQTPVKSYVLPALYRFLYCCGVRCCEARRLKCEDVHLDEGYLDILKSKAHRDRRLYISKELAEYLKEYDKAVSEYLPGRECFFSGINGGMIGSCTISANFRGIWLSAGLKRDGKVKPRAYDFRHHFACANIMRWSESGKNVHAMLPYLMRYMGHSTLESTYYYIHLIPDYFPKLSALTASLEELIPEVESDEV